MKTEETGILTGLRREMTREMFEELGALQCTPEEILGYVGTIRQDGLLAIRRASFEQLKMSASIVSQQYNRYLPGAGAVPGADAEAAIRALAGINVPGDALRTLYDEPEET